MLQNSFAVSGDVNKLLKNCSKIYNSTHRRTRPSTANVNRSSYKVDAYNCDYQSVKSHILSGNRPAFSSLNKTSSNFMRKLSFKAYNPKQSRVVGPKKILRRSKNSRRSKRKQTEHTFNSERILTQENREAQNKTSMSFTNVIIV